jgi:toxin FitB
MFLLDTNVVSEGSKPLPAAAVDRWFGAQDQGQLYLSAISVGELAYGIERLGGGRRKSQLRAWFEETVIVGFAGRVVNFDQGIALKWAALRSKYPDAKTADSQIAATALAFGLTVVTRNTRDFAFAGLSVFNPWEA